MAERRVIASGVQSNLRRGDGVEKGDGVCRGVVYKFSSVSMMEWSDKTELWRPIWKVRTNGQRDGEVML